MRLPRPPWKSLSSEITFVYASLSVVLVVLLSFIGYRLSSSVLEDHIRQELLATVDRTLAAMTAEIEERIRETHTLSLSPELRAAARRGTEWTEKNGLQVAGETAILGAIANRLPDNHSTAFLMEVKEAHPYIAEAFLTDRYGINAASSNITSDLRQDDELWWQLAVSQKFYLSQVEYDESARSYSYSIALPLIDEPHPPVGVIKVVFNFKTLQDMVRSVRVGQNGYLVVVSHAGLVMSHPDPDAIFRSVGDVPDLAPVAPLMKDTLRGVHEFTSDLADNEERWLLGYSRLMRPSSLGPLNWTLAALVSRAEIVSPIARVRQQAALAGLAFIVVAVPIVAAISRKLLQPLEDLALRADRIRNGDLNVGLDIESQDEIGRLAHALGSMVEKLKISHRRTLDINAGLERTVRERTEELQRKNRQIEAQNKRVMETSKLKSQFLANMSHELRTPLNAVMALSDIMRNEMSGPLNEEQSKQITIIHRSGKTLLGLINDVLDLSKIEAGRMSMEKTAMSLHGLIKLVAETLRPLADDKNLSLTVSSARDLPEFMTSDEHKLRQILINLVGNGIKFTERGSVTIATNYQKDPPTITFAITDTGIGIARDAMERIFEEFHQADGSTTRKYGGTGLGLTISKKMAELMGGTLTVKSKLGDGSTFLLTVPYVPAAPVPATAVETLRRVRMQMPEPALMNTADDTAAGLLEGRPTVLVAEDEMDNLYIMKKYLNRCGCQVVFAKDGNEVLRKARLYKPIAITLDLVLPKKSGWDVLSELKSDPETRNIPVIIASVLDNQERGFCLGAYRYLVKPVNERDLSDTIHQIQWMERKNVKRILIVDDNIVDADLTARLLPENKYEVLRASDGEEGIATAAREHPDLIMLDLGLPGMDGFQVLDALKKRQETSGIPIVIYTARDLSHEEQSRLQHGAERIFLKNPLEPARMLTEIGEILKTIPGSPQAPPDEIESSSGPAPPDLQLGLVPPENPASGRILLVEDDPANQYTLQLILAAEGYEVLVADNGREAIEKVIRHRPDIVLMDIMMPVMGGHEATKALKANQDVMGIPIIALTAAAMAGDREKALAAGCNDYISKPVQRAFLLERVDYWVRRQRSSSPDEIAPPAIASEDSA